MMRTGHLVVLLVALALTGCGDASTAPTPALDTPPTAAASPPAHDVAIVIPEAEDGQLAAGAIVEVTYPGGETRGHRHFVQRWDDQAWTDVYQLSITEPDEPVDEERLRNAWAGADEEMSTTLMGFQGSEGGQYAAIPPPAPPGTYRICDETRKLCSAAFEVTD